MSVQALDYQIRNVDHPTYQLSKVTPQTGSQTETITASGGQETIFELPPKVMNLSESILSFTATPLAPGDAARYNWLHIDGISLINQIQLYTRTGVHLVDINDLNKYMKMTMRMSHRIDDKMTWDKASDGSGYFEGLKVNNSATVTTATATRPTSNSCKTLITEPSYLAVGGGNTATPVISYKVPLKRIVDCCLSLNKDQYFGEVTYLRIVWTQSTKALFYATSATNPTTGTGSLGTATITLTKLTLYTALEQNQTINNEVMSKFNSDSLSYLVPYVYSNKQSLSSDSQNLSVRYNIAHGQKLKKVLISPFSSTETSSTTFDNRNIPGGGAPSEKVTDYYTLVNNVRRTQFNVDVSNGDYWMLHKNIFNNSGIQSSNESHYNFVIVEDFTADIPVGVNEDNLNDGLALDTEVKIDVNMTTISATYMHYVYAITLKKITVGRSGITLL
eukprot:Lithocolla_globosa_v1_NODE_2056_length_2188_cov_186.682607.p1 type:complete len:447 gc:universal NODE_2056_length_2188_cov_186.682607:1671-331(-)